MTAPLPAEAEMRALRRRWASGVGVVMTNDGSRYRGATVTAFAVVSLSPPLILVCLDPAARSTGLIYNGRPFTFSVLERRHEVLAERFASRAPLVDPYLTGVPHSPTPSGNMVLDGALAWFDCTVQSVTEAGDHMIVIGAVVSAALGEDTDDPLIYYEGRYRHLETV